MHHLRPAATAVAILEARAPLAFAFSLALACALACVVADAQGLVHAQRLAQSKRLPLGPMIASDTAALRAVGLNVVAHEGGSIMDMAIEPDRPIAWLVQGQRLLALDTSSALPREIGRSPIMPAPIRKIVVLERRILALEAGAPHRAWLVQAADPTWPRDVREVQLGGPIWSAAADGRHVAMVVGDELVELDAPPDGPPTVRSTLPLSDGRKGEDVKDMTLDEGLVALQLEADIVVHDIDAPEEPYSMPRGVTPTFATSVQIVDGRLYAIVMAGELVVLSVQPGRSLILEHSIHFPAGGSRRWVVYDVAVKGDQAAVLVQTHGAVDRSVRVLDLGDGVVDPEGRYEPFVVHVDRVAWRDSEQGAAGLLIADTERLAAIEPKDGTAQLEITSEWRPRFGLASNVLARGDDLASLGNDTLQMVDVSAPNNPRAMGHLAVPLRRDHFFMRSGLYGLWHGERMWLPADESTTVVDVSSPAAPRVAREYPWGSSGSVERNGWIYALSGSQLVILRAEPPDASPPVSRFDLGGSTWSMLGFVGHRLWLVTSSAPPGLVAIDASVPTEPVMSEPIPLSMMVTAGAVVDDRLIVLGSSNRSLNGVVVSVADISQGNPTLTWGELEYEGDAGPDALFATDIASSDHNTVLALSDGRLISLDLRYPAFPEETHVWQLPEAAYDLASTDGHLWLAGERGGLWGLHLGAEPDLTAERVLLPWIRR